MMVSITLNAKYNFYPMYNSRVWWDKSYFLGFMLALPLLIGMCFPRLVVVIRSMGLTGGYEISFLGIIFTSGFAMLALIKYGYFDSVQQAVTNVIYKSNEGLLVLDNNKYVLYYNSIFRQIFPEIKAEPILEAGYIQGYMFRAFDGTEHYRSIEELRRTAHIDALTGLYDREIFKQEITGYLSDGGIGALFMADVDYFKSINDNFGHIVGDEVFMTLSDAIRTVFGGHIYCRVGGYEFMMFVKDTNDTDILGSLAQKLNSVYSENVSGVAEGLSSSLSIGIVLSSSVSDDTESNEMFEALYALADKALYETKKKGRSSCSFYEAAKVI